MIQLSFLFLFSPEKRAQDVRKQRIIRDVPVRSVTDPNLMVNKKLLNNIERAYAIPKEGQADQDELRSCRIAIDQMRRRWDGGSFIFDAPLDNVGDAFVVLMTPHMSEELRRFGGDVIGIDSTHLVTQHGHYLTSLVVQNSGRRGVPVAFCISRKKDTETWQRFFRHVRDVVGVIQPAFFLSDGDFTYFNAWTAAVPLARQKNLGRMLKKLKFPDGEFSTIRDCLDRLAMEPDEDKFVERSDEFIQMLESRDEGRYISFRKYFDKYLGELMFLWPQCFAGSCPNTNMSLEHLHSELKVIHFEGLQNARLDRLIHHLLAKARSDVLGYTHALAKNAYTKKDLEMFNATRERWPSTVSSLWYRWPAANGQSTVLPRLPNT